MDLTNISTEELLRMRDASPQAPGDLSKIPTEELLRMRAGAPAGPTSPPPASPAAAAQTSDSLEGSFKQAGVGLAKGAIGLAGLPADLSGYLHSGSNWLASKITGEPSESRPSLVDVAGSENIRKQVEKYTGEFRKPQTRGERYIETAAEFVPSALAGPGGAARNVARFAIAPGVASEAAGEATKGTKFEPWARGGAALATGGAAALVTRPRTAESAVRGAIPDNVDQATLTAAERLFQEATAAGVPLTRAEAVQHVTGGASRLGDLQRVVEGQGALRPFFAQRPGQVETAARRTFDELAPTPTAPSTIGPAVGREAEGLVTDVRGAINRWERPLIRSVENQRIDPQLFAQVRSDPVFQEGLRRVRGDPWIGPQLQGLPDDSVRVVDAVKKQLDETGRNLRDPLAGTARNNYAAAIVDQGRRRAVDAADIATGSTPNQIGTYELFRINQEQARRRYLEPLLQGPIGKLANRDIPTRDAINVLFPTTPLAGSADEVGTAVRALARRNPSAARDLVRAHVESVFNESQRLMSTAREFGGAKFAFTLRGNPQQAANLEAAVRALPNGDQVWTGFDRFLQIVEAQGTRQKIGSQTAFNTEVLADLRRGTPLQEAGTAIATLGLKYPQKAKDALERWRLGQSVDQIARLLTVPEATHRFRQIASMPAGSREAASIMGRLALIAATGGRRSTEQAPQ